MDTPTAIMERTKEDVVSILCGRVERSEREREGRWRETVRERARGEEGRERDGGRGRKRGGKRGERERWGKREGERGNDRGRGREGGARERAYVERGCKDMLIKLYYS